ncbi:MAG: hypothetical protein QNK11_05510, partial [Legionella sp.]|nr:hypothetical protein [Legionella sp.]
MPKNYREVDFKIAGKNIKIAGMARPGFESQKPEKVFQFLSKNDYTTIISLQPNEVDKQLAGKCHPPIEYIEQQVKDFTSPSIEHFEAIYDRIKIGDSNPNEKIVIYCGEGFGRTGTVLAALKLKELMQAISMNQALIDEKLTSAIKLGKHAEKAGLFQCAPMLAKAIKAIRKHPESSDSVENEKQVRQLQQYQTYLIQQLNAERYKKDALLIQDAYRKTPEKFSLDVLKKMLHAKPQVILMGLV